MIKILAIGNSFSQDATTYLEKFARAAGVDAKVRNLYIGGCSLERHVNNLRGDLREYDFQTDGIAGGKKCTLKEGLLEDDWNIVTLQQASHFSGLWETYEPYLSELSAYVKGFRPNAKQVIHETWAYEKDSQHGAFPNYGCDSEKMHSALKSAYGKAAKALGTEIIPCGDIIAKLREYPDFDIEKDGVSLCRDGFHLNLIYGRYAAAAAWFEVLMGGNIYDSSFVPPFSGEEKPERLEERLALVKKTVHEICAAHKL